MKWLLDTCVISELPRPRPAQSVIQWLNERDEETLFLSVLTIGEPLAVVDSLIAATGLVHDCIVVTRNTRDLDRCGVRCFNPWEGH